MLSWSLGHRGHRRRHGGADPAEQRAALHDRRTRTSCRTTTSRSSRSALARAGRHEHRHDRADRQPHRARGSARCRRWSTRWSRSPTIRRRRRTPAPIYVRLKPLEGPRTRDQFAVMDDGARRRGAEVRGGQPADRRAAGGDDRRRRQPERGDPVHDQRAGPGQARAVRRRRLRTRRGSSRASSTSIRR